MKRSALRTLLLMLPFYGAYAYPYAPGTAPARVFAVYVSLQAKAVAAVVALFDPTARLHGSTVSGSFGLEVIRDCSSLDVQALLAAALLASALRWRAKLLGLGVGLFFLNLANVARIAALYAIGANLPIAFDTAHEELMPLALVVLACGFFAFWVNRAQHAPEAHHA